MGFSCTTVALLALYKAIQTLRIIGMSGIRLLYIAWRNKQYPGHPEGLGDH